MTHTTTYDFGTPYAEHPV